MSPKPGAGSWLRDLTPLREWEALFFLKYRMQILFSFSGDGKVTLAQICTESKLTVQQ